MLKSRPSKDSCWWSTSSFSSYSSFLLRLFARTCSKGVNGENQRDKPKKEENKRTQNLCTINDANLSRVTSDQARPSQSAPSKKCRVGYSLVRSWTWSAVLCNRRTQRTQKCPIQMMDHKWTSSGHVSKFALLYQPIVLEMSRDTRWDTKSCTRRRDLSVFLCAQEKKMSLFILIELGNATKAEETVQRRCVDPGIRSNIIEEHRQSIHARVCKRQTPLI